MFFPNSNSIEIHIYDFSRGGYVIKNSNNRQSENAPSSAGGTVPGNGSLFLALVVIYCNNIFKNIFENIKWSVNPSKWWFVKGVCVGRGACEKHPERYTYYVISHDKFLIWSNEKVAMFLAHGGGKRRYRKISKKSKRKRKSRKRKSRKRKSKRTKGRRKSRRKRKTKDTLKVKNIMLI